MSDTERQVGVLGIILAVFSAAEILTVLVDEQKILIPGIVVLVPANMIFLALLGFAGYWFARKLELPGIFLQGLGWHRNVLLPLGIGAGVGVVVTLIYRFSMSPNVTSDGGNLPALSTLLAVTTTAIGSQIAYSLFAISVLSRVASLISRGRWTAGWITVFVVVMAVVHGLAVFNFSVNILGGVPEKSLILVIMNGAIQLAAGFVFRRNGLAASIGVHFWSLLLWHTAMSLIPIA